MVIWLVVGVLYVVLGALYGIEAAARIEVLSEDDHEWDRLDIGMVVLASAFWPLALLAMLWYWGFEWRAEQIRKRAHGAG